MTDTEKLKEKIAGRVIVSCGYDSEYPCPYAHPTFGYEKCPHLDEDICMWQREQADQILQACKEAGLRFVPDELNIGEAVNPYRDESFQLAVAFDGGKFATRDAISSQIKEIE